MEPQIHQAQRHLHLEDQSSQPLFTLHRELVEIESISGNEHAVGQYLVDYLKTRNFTVEVQDVGPLNASLAASSPPPRSNIFAYRGESRKSRILVSSHIDTVPPFWPYEVRNKKEIWGRGSVDAKAAVAAQIIAVEELLAADELANGDVALLFVVGEEVNGDGMRKANDLGLEWEAVVFGEPTELKLASGHKGMSLFNIKAHGKAGHSGYPWLAESANSMLIPALAALDAMKLPSSEKYGNTTLNIGRMEGGVAANVIAEEASASVAVRLAAGTPEEARQVIEEEIKKIDDRLEINFLIVGYGPVDIDHDIGGFETIVCNYGTDIPNLEGKHKRYLYGPGSILVAHSDHEHLTSDDLTEAVTGYKTIIRSTLGK